MKTYKVIRFMQNQKSKVIRTGLTKKQAQAHCDRPNTSGPGWFDGWTKES